MFTFARFVITRHQILDKLSLPDRVYMVYLTVVIGLLDRLTLAFQLFVKYKNIWSGIFEAYS